MKYNYKNYLRKCALIAFVAIGVISARDAGAQVSVSATLGTTSGSYPTLDSAFTTINAGTHKGVITISITANTTELATPVPLLASGTGSSSYTSITIKPSGGNYTINSASSPSANRGIIELAGADNVTIDGDDPLTTGTQNLTIQSVTSTTAGIACIRLSSNSSTGTDGANNITVKNCILIGARSSSTATANSYGIQFSDGTSTSAVGTGAYSSLNTTIQNNNITRCNFGINALGNSTSYLNTGLVISGNTVGSATVANGVGRIGIQVTYTATSTTGSPLISDNDVRIGDPVNGYAANVAGIQLGAANTGATVRNNNVHDVANPESTGFGAAGIIISSATSNSAISIYNNFIRDITANNYTTTLPTTLQNNGIYITGAVTGLIINHNTVYLNAANATTYGTSNPSSSCLAIPNASATISQLLNNIFVNNQGSVSTAAYCIITSGTGNISGATMNNNDYYANTSGKIGYYNGTSYSTLSSWQTATGKDGSSYNIIPPFTSSTDLHIPASTSTVLESGGASTAITGITFDVDNQTRPNSGTLPDVGADEFSGTNPAPKVNFVSISPGVQCTASSHTVTANTTAGTSAITAVTLSYSVNGGTVTTVTMTGGTSTGTSSWTGTIPAATPSNGVVTYFVSVTDGTYTSNSATGTYQDAPLTGITATATANPSSICSGSSTVLTATPTSAGSAQVGAGGSTSSSTGSPFYHLYGGIKVQYIYTAAELNAAGLAPGNITALALKVTSVGTSYAGFAISAGTTTQSSFASVSAITAVSTVYTNSSFTPVVGTNTFTFSTPLLWNGTDNVVISICWSNNNTGGSSSAVQWDTYSSNVGIYIYSDNQSPSTMCGATTTLATGSSTTITGRPATIFSGTIGYTATSYSWSNGVSTVGTTNPLTVSPTVNTTYTATVFGPGGCSIAATPVTVTVLALPGAPTATNSVQCGVGVPTASVSGATGTQTYNWYSTATGGSPVQTGGSTYTSSVSTTTTFYVAINNGTCESVRTPVTVTVNTPNAITASTTTSPICANSSLGLSVSKAAGSNVYTYTWTASPAAGSGIPTSVSGASPTITPTIAGTYVYTVTGVDAGAGCTAVSTVTVTVSVPPPAPTVTPSSPTAFCIGGSQALTATPGTAIIFKDTFETFPLTQWATSGTGITVAQNTSYYYQGASSALMTYVASAAGQLTQSGNINLSQYNNPVLSFYQICATEATYDYGYIEYSTNGGTTWTSFPTTAYTGSGTLKNSVVSFDKSSYSDWGTQFTSSTSTPGTAPATSLWKQETINLAAYQTATQFKIRFRLTADASVQYYGWLLDSVAISGQPIVTYNWTSTPAGFTASTQNATATPTAAGTYNYKATVTWTANGCTASATTANVVVNPLPVINVTPATAAVCIGNGISLTASGATTYSWSGTGLSSTTGSTVTATPTTVGTASYTITGTGANGCVSTVTKNVTVNALPVISVSPSGAAVLCAGQSTTLTASGATSYSWSPATGLNTTTSATVTANPTTTQNYTVTGTDGNGCTNTATKTVTVNPLPVIVISPSGATSICTGQTVTLTASGATSYAWSPNTGLNTTTGATVIAGPTATQTYSIQGTDANGCQSTVTKTVTVNGLPTITISPSNTTTICSGTSFALTASGGVTYSWSPASSLTPSTGATVNAAPATTQTYTVTGTDANGCQGTATKTVNVNPSPTVTVSPGTVAFCVGQSASLTASGASSYVWTPATGLSSTTSATVTASPTTTTTYTVTGTASNGCTGQAIKVVTVNPLPTIIVSGSGNLCIGSSIPLSASGASTYTWTPSASLSSGTGSLVTASPTVTTTYAVTGTDGNGCVNSTNKTVTVNALPTIAISPGTALIICAGISTSLTASGGVSYNWTPSTGLSTTTAATVSASPTATTTYTVTGTDGNGCQNTASKTVTVNPLPTVTISPTTAVAVCSGAGATLTASGASSYTWTPITGLTPTTGATVTASPSISTIYTVTGTDANGCTNTASRLVTVLGLPTIVISPLTPVTICEGFSATLTASGAITYSWTPSSSLSAATGASVTASPIVTTTYTITGTAANGCQNSTTKTVNVLPKPSTMITPSGYINVCSGDTVRLKATSNPDYGYQWLLYGTPVAASGTDSILATVTGGFYTVRVTNLNTNCPATTPVPTVITVTPRPRPVITAVGATMSAGSGYQSYQWLLNGVPVAGATSGTYTPTHDGYYSVMVTDTTGLHCAGTSEVFHLTALGITTTTPGETIRIYPNPAADVLHVDAPAGTTVTVMGMDGKLVFTGMDVHQLSIATWADGVYRVIVRDREGTYLKGEKVTKVTR